MADLALSRRYGGHWRSLGGRMWALACIVTVLAFAGAPIAYMVWPRAVPVAPGAPTLPITVGGVTFNVPPAAIRVPMQRRPGAQARIDLAFAWPSLEPVDLTAKPAPTHAPNLLGRLFVTIATGDGTLTPVERLKVIYPRYAPDAGLAGRDGLIVRVFRPGTPYQGEDLIYDPSSPERFLLRCTRSTGVVQGVCLHERRIAGADVTLRFPRSWLDDWRNVAERFDRLIASLRPAS